MNTNDIESEEDIKQLVDHFYTKIRKDELLAPVFSAIIKDNWDNHLHIMCNFWSTILLYSKKYTSDPMYKHMAMPVEKKHFDRWLQLFEVSVDELFSGEKAEEAKKRANNIARVMQSMKNNSL